MRIYQANKVTPQQVSRLPVKAQPVSQPQEWEDGKLLHGLEDASLILNSYLGGGFSVKQIRRRIHDGTWEKGVHWTQTGRLLKVNIRAIVDWQLSVD